jgi:TonB family protein
MPMRQSFAKYLPLFITLPLFAVIAACAVTAVMPEGNNHDTRLPQIHADIDNDISSVDEAAPGISYLSNLSPGNNDIDIDELNRRLIAEGLDPLIIDSPPVETPAPPLVPPPTEIPSDEPGPPENIIEPDNYNPPPTDELPIATKNPPRIPAAESSPAMQGPIVHEPVIVDASYRVNPEPEYPSAAERKGLEGMVRLLVTVGSDGKPLAVEISVSSGYAILDNAAADAVMNEWTFNPATRDGLPVESTVEVPLIFQIEK